VCRSELGLQLPVHHVDRCDADHLGLADAAYEPDICELYVHAQVVFGAFEVKQNMFESILFSLARDELGEETAEPAALDHHLLQVPLQTAANTFEPRDGAVNVVRLEGLLVNNQIDHGPGPLELLDVLVDQGDKPVLTLYGASYPSTEPNALLKHAQSSCCGCKSLCLRDTRRFSFGLSWQEGEPYLTIVSSSDDSTVGYSSNNPSERTGW